MIQRTARTAWAWLLMAGLALAAGRPTFEDLVANLKSPNAATRREAAAELGKSRRREAVTHLAALVRDPDAKVRMEVVRALRELRDVAAVPALVASLSDGEATIREEAIGTLVEVYAERERGNPVKGFLDLFSDEYDRSSVPPYTVVEPSVVRGLANELRDEDKGIREESALALRQLYEANKRKESGLKILAALSRIGDPAQADLFGELLQDPDPDHKRLAIEGLGRISDASRLPGFKKDYQRERNDELKLAYSFALTLLGDRAFLDTIVLTLPSRLLGTRARGYLMEMGQADRSMVSELYPYLNDPEADIRAALCDIIASFGDADAIPRLEPLINDPSSTVADKANRAVERLRRARRAPASD